MVSEVELCILFAYQTWFSVTFTSFRYFHLTPVTQCFLSGISINMKMVQFAKAEESIRCKSSVLLKALVCALPILTTLMTLTVAYLFFLFFFTRATTRQNVSSGVSSQARHKPACTATQAS